MEAREHEVKNNAPTIFTSELMNRYFVGLGDAMTSPNGSGVVAMPWRFRNTVIRVYESNREILQ